jgi:SPP1 family predicted phage head-tail adaptor
MTYRSGELDQFIDIKRATRVSDGYGGDSSTTIAIVSDLYTHVRPINGREAKQYDKLNAQFTNLFVIRWRDDVLENDTIVWDGDDYNIKSIVKAGGRKLFLEIYAERGLAT